MKRSLNDDLYTYFKVVSCVCLILTVHLSCFFPVTSAFAQKDDSLFHVLLLNSYHKGYKWSDEITRGVEENLVGKGAVLHVEYMDTKRHFGEPYFSLLSQLLLLKHSTYQYDVIIVADNNAFEFVKERGKAIFGDTPVVFCGLNYLTREDIEGLEYLSGVNEKADLKRNISLIRRLHPERHKLMILTDDTPTGKKIQQEVNSITKELTDSELEIELVFDISVDELIDKLSGLDDQTSLLFTFFFRDRDGMFLEYDEGIGLVVEHTRVPIYVSWNFSMRDGVMGGYLTDGYDQGAEAVHKVNQILAGRPISQIPITWESPTRFSLDYLTLKKFNVAMKAVPAEAEILNLPLTFLQEYKELIIKVSIVITLLILVVLALIYGLFKSRRAEETLRKAEDFISSIINSMPSALVGVDSQGRVTHWNSGAKALTGIAQVEAVGQPLERVFPRLQVEMGRVREAMRTREVMFQPRQAHSTETQTCFEDVTVYPLTSNGIEGAVIKVDDVTEKVRLEEMMVQSEKMLSVGGLAAGMAHEINNPLAGMIQTASVIKDRLTKVDLPANIRAAEAADIEMSAIKAYMDSRGIPKMLERIRQSGARAAEIVTNMLQFARKSNSIISSYDLAEVLDQCLELAGSDYDLKKRYDFRQITIVKQYQKNLPSIPCEKSKIQQVLLNILRNGAESMQENPDPSHEEYRFVLRLMQADPGWVRIEIEDNGPGMDESVRKRVFEPFFTTKPVDMGTGLGLSVSYFIITENHSGRMKVESKKGHGTKFIIELPMGGARK